MKNKSHKIKTFVGICGQKWFIFACVYNHDNPLFLLQPNHLIKWKSKRSYFWCPTQLNGYLHVTESGHYLPPNCSFYIPSNICPHLAVRNLSSAIQNGWNIPCLQLPYRWLLSSSKSLNLQRLKMGYVLSLHLVETTCLPLDVSCLTKDFNTPELQFFDR